MMGDSFDLNILIHVHEKSMHVGLSLPISSVQTLNIHFESN